MKRLHALVGTEHELADVGRELRSVVRSLSPNVVGALHVHCSDEAEHEGADAFRHTFAQELLPRLKYGSRVPFLVANLGGRYEWGAVRLTEDHFAIPEAAHGFKVIVAKVNSHVSVTRSGAEGYVFSTMDRYGAQSTFCGAIHGLLCGSDLPFARDLGRTLRSEGTDRVAILRDPALVDPALRVLFGAILSARMQARLLVQDIQDHVPAGPTLYLVVHGITLNKPGLDTELVGGVYEIDRRDAPRDRYRGLGDDPAAYELSSDVGRLCVSDPSMNVERDARDHRRLAEVHVEAARDPAESSAAHEVIARVRRKHGTGFAVGRALLKPMLIGLATASPVPAALVLAAEGAVAIHDVHKLHQKGDDDDRRRTAQDVIDAVHRGVDAMPKGVAERVARRLVERLGPTTANVPADAAE